jgi:hypothetical protein
LFSLPRPPVIFFFAYLYLSALIRYHFNTNADQFCAATLQWFHDNAGLIINRMNDAFSISLPNRTIEWHADIVNDFRGHTVFASAERLRRWDYRHPNVIFRDGFRPRYDAQLGDPLEDQYVDFERHVRTNLPSIFVLTTRYYRNERNSAVRWTPRQLANRFEYEIFAFGGIDVNRSFGPDHNHFNQRGIAFPGGDMA